MNPSSGGLEPTCTTELKIARFLFPFLSAVPIRFALLKPEMELISLSRDTLSIERISLAENVFVGIYLGWLEFEIPNNPLGEEIPVYRAAAHIIY